MKNTLDGINGWRKDWWTEDIAIETMGNENTEKKEWKIDISELWDNFKHPNNTCVTGVLKERMWEWKKYLKKLWLNIFKSDENNKPTHPRSSIKPKHRK